MTNEKNQEQAKPEAQSAANPTDQQQESPPSQQLRLIRDEEFTSLYANNIRFESSVWDLKLLFGELDQSIDSNNTETVVMHTAVAIPWSTAKLGLYYLGFRIAMHELENGKITINPRVLPPPLPPLTSIDENNDLVKRAHEIALKLRADFLANL